MKSKETWPSTSSFQDSSSGVNSDDASAIAGISSIASTGSCTVTAGSLPNSAASSSASESTSSGAASSNNRSPASPRASSRSSSAKRSGTTIFSGTDSEYVGMATDSSFSCSARMDWISSSVMSISGIESEKPLSSFSSGTSACGAKSKGASSFGTNAAGASCDIPSSSSSTSSGISSRPSGISSMKSLSSIRP